MKVYYMKEGYDINQLKDEDTYVIILKRNYWNDYGYETSFNVFVSYDGVLLEWDRIKLLFFNQTVEISSSAYIESLMNPDDQYIDFDSISEPFISVNNFYEEYYSFLQSEEYAIDFSKKLFDLLYIEHMPDTIMNTKLYEQFIKKEGFEVSLLRESNIQADRKNGYIYSINPRNSSSLDCKFEFKHQLNNKEYKFNFDFTLADLPNRINVLIGKNGVGKTKTLEAIVEKFCDRNADAEFTPFPSFIRNLIVYSYNPYENIPIKNDSISFDYQYFGPRRFKDIEDGIPTKALRHAITYGDFKLLQYIYSYEFYAENIDEAISILKDKFQDINEERIKNILETCNYFIDDYIVDYSNYKKITKDSLLKICAKDKRDIQNKDSILINFLYSQLRDLIPSFQFVGIQIDNTNYPIMAYTDATENMKNTNAKFVILDSNREEIPLSSGQNTFIQFIVNTLSMIRRNSLIIIDEPENTLHPTFEVDMMLILKKILSAYDSFAIIATHSGYIAREVPSQSVKIIVKDNVTGEIDIQKPVINTFGASIGTINNYVFDDLYKEKTSINEWLKEQYIKITTYEEFETKYIDLVSSELMQTAYSHYKRSADV